jgi:hypothetical protein
MMFDVHKVKEKIDWLETFDAAVPVVTIRLCSTGGLTIASDDVFHII